MQYGCIGEHLGHSFSAEIHALLADYKYEICEVARDSLDDFMRRRDFCGINVTIPYKQAVIPYLYYVDESAKAIGAVNTVVNRDGRLYGYNTDVYGMTALINRIGIEMQGKKVAVLGTGGTSKTARAVSSALGAREIIRVSRQAGDGLISYDELYRSHTDVEVIINTTPCGMYPYADGGADRVATPVDVSRFPALCGVVDAVYNPLRTNLILDARDRGIPSEGGLYMLVAQAVRASEIFLDTVYPDDVCESVYGRILKSKENVVLCGMPSSGKSTVGRLLSERLSRSFVDTDEVIVDVEKCQITDIFRERGEKAFRDIESEAVRAVSEKSGDVIATGGGAILRDENVRRLKRNGCLVFLDRPLSELIPTSDRPLASDREAIEKRYNERYPRYNSVADIRISVDTDACGVADKIIKELEL
jgi:shikimate dehydrogenase